MDFIPILVPTVPSVEKFLPYLLKIEANKQYTNFGPLSKLLTSRLGDYFGVSAENVVLAANATLALQGAMETAETSKEATWEVPSWTFTATASAAVLSQVKFKFVDVDDNGRAQFSGAATCAVDVLPFGAGPRFAEIPANIETLIVDAAASIDSLQQIKLPSNMRVGLIVSLHATKLLPAGEGGIFLTNDPGWAERFRRWTNFGMAESRISSSVGTNAKLSEFSSAVALASMDSWEQTRNAYRGITARAKDICNRLKIGTFSSLSPENITPYWILRLVSPEQKATLERLLQENLIQCRDWWPAGCHSMPAYSEYSRGKFFNTDVLISRTLALPFHLYLSDNDWGRVESVLTQFVSGE
jgi:dTDP-4-amino-4,6-dideoxygalactose transaminase